MKWTTVKERITLQKSESLKKRGYTFISMHKKKELENAKKGK